MVQLVHTPPPDYRVAHLLVLIGENPLPAYIAARTMLKLGGILYPIYTTRTVPVLERLRLTLAMTSSSGEIGAIEPIALDDYESDAFYISSWVKRAVNAIGKQGSHDDQSIGLNYTGGTGPMGVHSYNTLRALRPDAVFSYLDPRRLEMCVDRSDGERVRRKLPLNVTLDELIKLHGLPSRRLSDDMDESESVMGEAACEMAILQASAESERKGWQTWCTNVLEAEGYKSKSRNWKSKTQLRDVTLKLETLSVGHRAIFDAHFPSLIDGDVLRLGAVSNQGPFRSPEKLCKWLHGTWLESYVLDQVKGVGGAVHSAAQSVKIPREDKPLDDYFEFDIAFIIGYQLFAISCTTSQENKTCKLKLFEAAARARQLGGDEARIGLVCMHDDPSRLKDEIAPVLDNRKIAVFGCNELPELTQNIREWVTDNGRHVL